jgi:hypothetical protein
LSARSNAASHSERLRLGTTFSTMC